MTSRPIIGYWNIRAGPRGNINRHIMAFSGVDYEDKRYELSTDEWANNDKKNLGLDFPNLPYVIDGDFKLTESKAVSIYLCEKYAPSLLGTTPEDHAHAHMLHEIIYDCFMQPITIAFRQDDPKDAVLAKFYELLPPIVDFLGDKNFFLGTDCGLPDLLMFEMSETINTISGNHDLWTKFPTLEANYDRVCTIPNMAAYRASDKFVSAPFLVPFAKLKI